MQLVAEGMKSEEIASHLCISVKTVSSHRRHIMKKLNLKSQADITRYVAEVEPLIRRSATLELDGLLPTPVLKRISNRILNEVKGFSRVCLDISSKPPATIEWE